MSNYISLLLNIIKHRRHLNRAQIGEIAGYSRAHITKAVKDPGRYPEVLASLKLNFPKEAEEAKALFMESYPGREFDDFEMQGSAEGYETQDGQSKKEKTNSDKRFMLASDGHKLHEIVISLKAEYDALLTVTAENVANGDDQQKEAFITRVKQIAASQQATSQSQKPAPPKPSSKTRKRKPKQDNQQEPEG